MRSSTILVAFASLAVAEQIPLVDQLKGWWSQATGGAASAVSVASSSASAAASSIPNPVDAAAAAVAAGQVTRVTVGNYESVLAPGVATSSPGVEEWLIFVTGGNKTCLGLCGHAEEQWNRSVPIVSATKGSPNLGLISCESDAALCYAWNINPPQLVHFRIPQPGAGQSQALVESRYITFNRTTVTAGDIAKVATSEEYQKTEPYRGWFEPFHGQLAQAGVGIYLGHLISYLNVIPSWVFMIGVSFLSRTIMSRRMGTTPRQ